MSTIEIIAAAALAVFTVLMVGIGVYSRRRAATLDGFLLGGRKIGPWMSAFAYGTSYFSAVIFIGYAGKHGWDIGFASMWIGVGNALLGAMLAWMLLARRTRRMTHRLGSKTMPEFFEARYQCRGMKLYSAVIIFVFLVPYAAGVYKGLGTLFSAVFPSLENNALGLDPTVICMLIVALLTAVYLILGGYVATTITDFVQGLIMLAGVVIMVVAIVNSPEVGGLSAGLDKLTAMAAQDGVDVTSPWGGENLQFLAINILLTSFGAWGLPQMVHKFYAIRDESSIRKATIISTVFALVIGCGAYFVGTFGRVFLDNQLPAGGYDAVVPTLLMKAFSTGLWQNILLAVILLLVLSASMSTLSSVVLTSSSAITVDLLGAVRPQVKPKTQMRLTRLFCLLFVACSFVFATFNFAIIVSIMSFSWGVVAGCFLGPYLWGLYSRRTTRAGAWAGLVGGLVVVMAMTVINMCLHGFADGAYAAFQAASANSPLFGVIAMSVSVVIVPVVSRFTAPPDAAHVQALFAPEKEEA